MKRLTERRKAILVLIGAAIGIVLLYVWLVRTDPQTCFLFGGNAWSKDDGCIFKATDPANPSDDKS